jgi:NAD(P)-dependent dehydrogenase (short-subunit alcohol dehydrogenase family)
MPSMTTGSKLLEGKVALVTGAASGIGAATAAAFAREGATVLGADLKGDPPVDVTDEAQVEALLARVLAEHGRLDCAVNNAGITGAGGPLQTLRLEDWLRTITVNLTSVFLCMKHEIRAMKRSGGGAIVNLSSGAGLIGVPFLAPYAASKHGVLGLTKTAALENAATGIRVNAICPGSVDTPMLRGFMQSSPEAEKMILRGQPGGRLGRPEEIAEAAVWLCSDRASFVTGESMLVDGGAVAR